MDVDPSCATEFLEALNKMKWEVHFIAHWLHWQGHKLLDLCLLEYASPENVFLNSHRFVSPSWAENQWAGLWSGSCGP